MNEYLSLSSSLSESKDVIFYKYKKPLKGYNTLRRLILALSNIPFASFSHKG